MAGERQKLLQQPCILDHFNRVPAMLSLPTVLSRGSLGVGLHAGYSPSRSRSARICASLVIDAGLARGAGFRERVDGYQAGIPLRSAKARAAPNTIAATVNIIHGVDRFGLDVEGATVSGQ